MNKYYIIFKAYNANIGIKSLGHGFVEFRKKLGNDPVLRESFGFYPTTSVTLDDALEGNSSGTLRGDDYTAYDIEYVKEVTLTDFSAAIAVRDQWQSISSAYKLFERDCLSFVQEIARSINLVVPRRASVTLTPTNYSEELKAHNLGYLEELFLPKRNQTSEVNIKRGEGCRLIAHLSVLGLQHITFLACLTSINPLVCQVSAAMQTVGVTDIAEAGVESACNWAVKNVPEYVEATIDATNQQASVIKEFYEIFNSIDGILWLETVIGGISDPELW